MSPPAAPALSVVSPQRRTPMQQLPAAAAPQSVGLPLRTSEAQTWEEVSAAAQQLIAAKLREPAAGSADLQASVDSHLAFCCIGVLRL